MSGMMYAESVSCTNENGKCEFFEDGSYECQCSDESPFGGTGVAGSPSDEEVTMPTNEECLAMVDEMCGIPEGSVTCENPAGKCFVYPDGTYFCNCLDGSGEGGGSSEPGDPGVDPEETDPGETPVEGEGDSSDGSDTTEPEPAVSCSTDEDCEKGYICMDGYCVSTENPDTDPELCTQDLDCPENYICTEGVCEFNGEIEMPVCEDVLVEVCGTEAPDLKKICSEESLPYCVNALSTLAGKCYKALPEETVNELLAGTWNDYALEVANCCRGYETEKTYYDDLTQCLETKACEECMGQFEEATGEDDVNEGGDTGDTGDTANTGNTGNTGDTGDTDASFEDDPVDKSTGDSSSTGCSIVNI